MDNKAIITWIFNNHPHYPGIHLSSHSRTLHTLPPLSPIEQFQTVLQATSSYLTQQLQHHKGIFIQGFGTFCFQKEYCASRNSSRSRVRDSSRKEYRLQPCFIPHGELRKVLAEQVGRVRDVLDFEEVQMRGFNPTGIALACHMEKWLVEEIIGSFLRAVVDLIELGRKMTVRLCGKLTISDRQVKYTFN